MTISISMPDRKMTIPTYLMARNYETLQMAGVYFLYSRKDELLYVGQSKNVYTRIKQHIAGRDSSGRFADDIELITVYFVSDDYEREIYETYAINEYKPLYNTGKVFFNNITSAGLEIDEMIHELDEEKWELIVENRKINAKEDDDSIFLDYEASHEKLRDWGVMMRNTERIDEIDAEIRRLRREKGRLPNKD